MVRINSSVPSAVYQKPINTQQHQNVIQNRVQKAKAPGGSPAEEATESAATQAKEKGEATGNNINVLA